MSTRPQSAGANRTSKQHYSSNPAFSRAYEPLEHHQDRRAAPYLSSPTHKKQEVLWLGHTPNKPKRVEVMTMSKMGTTEKLHNSHFFNMSVAAGAEKHKKLILNAKTQVDSKLHPFVQSERERLKARKHLEAVDELTKDVDIPDTLKHHSAFNAVYGWILTHNQHHDRISKLSASVSNSLPAHCKHFRDLRDSNRIKAMSDQQKKLYFKRLEADKVQARERRRRYRENQGMYSAPMDYTGEFGLAGQDEEEEKNGGFLEGGDNREAFMDFLSPETPYSNTGLRRANTHNVGYVEQGTNSREKHQRQYQSARNFVDSRSDYEDAGGVHQDRSNTLRDRASAKLRGSGDNMSFQKKQRPTSAPNGRKVLPKKTYVFSNASRTQPAKDLLNSVNDVLRGSRPVQKRQSQGRGVKESMGRKGRDRESARTAPVWRDEVREGRVEQNMSSTGNMILLF